MKNVMKTTDVSPPPNRKEGWSTATETVRAGKSPLGTFMVIYEIFHIVPLSLLIQFPSFRKRPGKASKCV